jgi:hypothetical protein
MPLYSISIIIVITLSLVQVQTDDPRVHVSNTADSKVTMVETDYLTLVNTDDDFLQIKFVSGYRKGAGLQSITIEALFLGSSDLYKSENKREFTLIVDGDRFDYGAMMYSRYTVEEHDGKETFYAGVPPTCMNPTIPSDARVITFPSRISWWDRSTSSLLALTERQSHSNASSMRNI